MDRVKLVSGNSGKQNRSIKNLDNGTLKASCTLIKDWNFRLVVFRVGPELTPCPAAAPLLAPLTNRRLQKVQLLVFCQMA